MNITRQRIPHKLLIIGVLCSFIGSSLLLHTMGFLTGIVSFWPVVFVFLGMFLLYRVFFKEGKEGYIFSGLFSILAGAFLLLLNTSLFELHFKNIWPLFMMFVGVSLFAYGMKKHRDARIRMIIPAIAIVLLSIVFLLFSLNIVSMSLRRFVVLWWPALLVFSGFVLIVLDVSQGKRRPRDKQRSGKAGA